MNKIPTAEELFKNHNMTSENGFSTSIRLAREFAKLHVEAALKTAYKATKEEEWIDNFINLKESKCKKSILNAYPLTNIK